MRFVSRHFSCRAITMMLPSLLISNREPWQIAHSASLYSHAPLSATAMTAAACSRRGAISAHDPSRRFVSVFRLRLEPMEEGASDESSLLSCAAQSTETIQAEPGRLTARIREDISLRNEAADQGSREQRIASHGRRLRMPSTKFA